MVRALDKHGVQHSALLTTAILSRYLPDVYWTTVFGPAYAKHFGRERLLTTPARQVTELTGGGTYLQLTKNPLDAARDYRVLDSARRRVKEHLIRRSPGERRMRCSRP